MSGQVPRISLRGRSRHFGLALVLFTNRALKYLAKRFADPYNVKGNGNDNRDCSDNNDHPNDPWEAASPPLYGEMRPSCMECVTKHVGAAMVLLSETKNGYPHYLLAIGHLHEAEEESQAWPDLAATIRTARKELQTTGTVPEWDGITKMMKTLNDYSGAS
jgi:hypothetical protein